MLPAMPAALAEPQAAPEFASMADYESALEALKYAPPAEETITEQPPAPPTETPEASSETPPESQDTPPADAQSSGLANNWRLDAGGDPVTQLSFQIMKEQAAKGEHVRPSVAEAMARERLHPTTPAGTPPADEAPPVDEASPPTEDPALAALRQQDAALAEKLKTASADFDDAAIAEIIDQRTAIGRQIVKAELRAELAQDREAQNAAAREASMEAALAQSRAAVKAAYGDAVTQGSTMGLLMQGIAAQWEATGDPRFLDPRLPELAAQEAATQLGIKPASGGAATAPPVAPTSSAPQASPRSTPPVAPPIAPGSARSTDPGPGTLPEFRSMEEYDAYMQKHFGVGPI